ncbi:D-alanine transaminase/branched-chain amino acid aminotransferase [Pontibacter mucosus]|uniref:branched-chain-amino-acid transaminase n=1 Tax=Pontibacter mucosus TaxID=1649266 RepID=A0A2T5YQA0_9BACT|nr:aminotransferase class IV [Pontibacter mucosus]PTX21482.1 D-alanine transaminase/branched-chain amino acid aminotransferase [Pontibacter mucosus]
MQSNPNFAYVRGQVLPLEQATLHISDLSIQRGYGVFDYFRVFHGKPVFLDDYLERFHASAAAMNLEVPVPDSVLREAIDELIRRNNLPLSGMKMILTGGYSENGYDPAEASLIIQQQPLILPGPEMLEQGINVITHEYVREVPRAKTINYTMGIRLIGEIRRRGASDVLYQQNGVVSEFPRCNLFIVKQDNTVVTPADNVLLGVTRKNVLALAGKKYKAAEGTVTLEDVYGAKEVFLTSTTKRIVPIVQVDERVIGNGKPGEVTLSLLQDLVQLEEEKGARM